MYKIFDAEILVREIFEQKICFKNVSCPQVLKIICKTDDIIWFNKIYANV